MAIVQSGPFAGMDTTALQPALARAQQAYIELSSGSKAQTVSYDTGSGSKSVTFTQASIANLSNLITQLQRALGIGDCRPRRPIMPVFR